MLSKEPCCQWGGQQRRLFDPPVLLSDAWCLCITGLEKRVENMLILKHAKGSCFFIVKKEIKCQVSFLWLKAGHTLDACWISTHTFSFKLTVNVLTLCDPIIKPHPERSHCTCGPSAPAVWLGYRKLSIWFISKLQGGFLSFFFFLLATMLTRQKRVASIIVQDTLQKCCLKRRDVGGFGVADGLDPLPGRITVWLFHFAERGLEVSAPLLSLLTRWLMIVTLKVPCCLSAISSYLLSAPCRCGVFSHIRHHRRGICCVLWLCFNCVIAGVQNFCR